MAVGYAAFNTELKISGTSKVTSNWDIEITNVTNGTPVGSAQNTVAPTWDALTASMEADLYEKGDAMEYDVTIENKGTIDAKLNDVLTNIENANSEAVNITFSGYTKGEILKAGSIKIIHVKIEYNPNYEGEETSSEVEINFEYEQNNNDPSAPSSYLLTYDYKTNGGSSADREEEYVTSQENVNLDNIAYKEGYKFVGWNTNKDAQIGLKEYQMPNSDEVLYAIYSKELKVTYEKGENVESIGKNNDICTVYNNETSCEVTLPGITATSENIADGWYYGEEKVGKANDNYSVSSDITLISKIAPKPIIKSWTSDANEDFHTDEYRQSIKTIDFLDNKNVPSNAISSWDVSEKQDGSVMAWIMPDESDESKHHLYIGGTNGVIANEDSSFLFMSYTATSINFNDNFDTSNTTNMSYMFYASMYLKELKGIENWNVSNVENMSWMFCYAREITELDLNKWDTGKVKDMSYMFSYTTGNPIGSGLKKLSIDKWNVSNVENMSWMFFWSDINSLDLSSWDTGKVKNMSQMFHTCQKLVTLNLSSWNVSNVTDMSYMFGNCKALRTLNLDGWNTKNVTNMAGMFWSCSSLTKLELCSFDNSKVTSVSGMFSDTVNLESIFVGPNWQQDKENSSMYTNSKTTTTIKTDNCKLTAENIKLSITVQPNKTSITVVSKAEADSGIAKYEYSIDDGKSWIESTNTYTFNELTPNTNYNISVKITSNLGKTITKKTKVNVVDDVVTEGEGIYEDINKVGRYVYKGENPNNYIIFNNELWRIISKEADGTYKIVRLEVLPERVFDEAYHRTQEKNTFCKTTDYNCNAFAAIEGEMKGFNDENIGTVTEDSSIKTYLNEDYYNSLTEEAKDLIIQHKFNIGIVSYNDVDGTIKLKETEEERNTWTGNVGLAGVVDVLKASTNPECISIHNSMARKCNDNYLLYSPRGYNLSYWLINGTADFYTEPNGYSYSNTFGYNDYGTGNTSINFDVSYEKYSVRPVVYLNSNITLSGDGTYENPYRINDKLYTTTIEKPSFKENGETDKTVTITYPKGCDDNLVCTYQVDDGEEVDVKNEQANIEFQKNGTIVAKVSDGTNSVSSSYTVYISSLIGGQKVELVQKGDGLYEDEYDKGRYIYRGLNPDNYIEFNNEIWRIIARESDGTYKIIRNSTIGQLKFDEANSRTTEANSYCITPDSGCNVFAKIDGEISTPDGSIKGTVTEDSYIKKYLNETFYDNIDSNSKSNIVSHTFYIGMVKKLDYYDKDQDSIKQNQEDERRYTWQGNVGLANTTDILKASTNPLCKSLTTSQNIASCNHNYLILPNTSYWTINGETETNNTSYVTTHYGEYSSEYVSNNRASTNYSEARPVVYLKENLKFKGNGTLNNPFQIES